LSKNHVKCRTDCPSTYGFQNFLTIYNVQCGLEKLIFKQ